MTTYKITDKAEENDELPTVYISQATSGKWHMFNENCECIYDFSDKAEAKEELKSYSTFGNGSWYKVEMMK